MVKIIDYGDHLKREPMYFKAKCPHCGAELVFEYGDIWWDTVTYGSDKVGRIECPVCRTKVFLNFEYMMLPKISEPRHVTSDIYENAYKDTSKRGLQRLMEEKKMKDQEVITNENTDR